MNLRKSKHDMCWIYAFFCPAEGCKKGFIAMKQKNCAVLLLLLFLLTGCGAADSTDTAQEETASISAAQEEASGSDVTLEDVTKEAIAIEEADSNSTAAEETPEDAATESASAEVTLEDAKAAALAHAGVEASAASFTKARLHQDGTAYEIEFSTTNGAYQYEFSAESGELLEYRWEVQGKDVSTGTAVDSLDSAKALALTHAGVEDSAVSFAQEKLDDGIYELEFTTATGKYEYEISRETGIILEYEWEVQGNSATAASSAASGTDSTDRTVDAAITADRAESIALEDAGIASGDTKYLHAYVEWRHGAPYSWCVRFGVRDTEYVYLIDLDDGSILEQYVESH